MRRIAAVVLVALAGPLAGCASTAGTTAASAPASRPAPTPLGTPAPAIDLLPTVWHVHGAAGADPATYLLFTAGEVEVLEPKGFVELEWATQGDRMLTTVGAWAMSLGTTHQPTVPWLTATTTFSRMTDGWVLQGGDGGVLATLTDDGPAPPQRDSITTPEPITRFTRAAVADAVAGAGAGLGGESIVGRWGVSGLDSNHASVTISRDGTWSVEGGCQSGLGDLQGDGSYRVLEGGLMLMTSGAIAGVGCSMLPHPPADSAALLRFSEARSVALSGDHLTLFDRSGKRIGTLTRLT